jgi:hypothetical protein
MDANWLVPPQSYWDGQDFDWGYSDGLNGAPLPNFLPPPAYFAGRAAGGRNREQSDAA